MAERCRKPLDRFAISVLVGLSLFACKRSSKIEVVKPTGAAQDPNGQQQEKSADGIRPDTSPGVLPAALETNFKGFLTALDIPVPADQDVIDKAQLPAAINGMRDAFYLRNPHDKNLAGTNCYDNVFATSHYKANKTGFVYELQSPDFSACLNSTPQQDPKLKVTYNRAVIHHLEKVTCEGVDLSAFNDKIPSQITAQDQTLCNASKSSDQIINTLIEYDFTLTSASGSLEVASRSIVTAMTQSGTSCHGTNNGGEWKYDPCIFTQITTYGIKKESGTTTELKSIYKSNFFQAVGKDLTGKANSQFYDSGSFQVTYNNWHGAMTYGGGQVNPQWSLANGPDTATGAFTGEDDQPK